MEEQQREELTFGEKLERIAQIYGITKEYRKDLSDNEKVAIKAELKSGSLELEEIKSDLQKEIKKSDFWIKLESFATVLHLALAFFMPVMFLVMLLPIGLVVAGIVNKSNSKDLLKRIDIAEKEIKEVIEEIDNDILLMREKEIAEKKIEIPTYMQNNRFRYEYEEEKEQEKIKENSEDLKF